MGSFQRWIWSNWKQCKLKEPRLRVSMHNELEYSLCYLQNDWAEIFSKASLWSKEASLKISAWSLQPFRRYQNENSGSLSMDNSKHGLLSSHHWKLHHFIIWFYLLQKSFSFKKTNQCLILNLTQPYHKKWKNNFLDFFEMFFFINKS